MPLPDGKRLLIQGGYNYESTPLTDQSIIYNAETNAWEKFSNYYDANNGGRSTNVVNYELFLEILLIISCIRYYGTGIYIPNLNGIGFYGGYQE